MKTSGASAVEDRSYASADVFGLSDSAMLFPVELRRMGPVYRGQVYTGAVDIGEGS
jgi:hypothetical protein